MPGFPITIANSDSQSISKETFFLKGISPYGELILRDDLVNIIMRKASRRIAYTKNN